MYQKEKKRKGKMEEVRKKKGREGGRKGGRGREGGENIRKIYYLQLGMPTPINLTLALSANINFHLST